MTVLFHILQMLAAIVVLAEALNKLERADLFDGKRGLLPRLGGLSWALTPWRWKRSRVDAVMKVGAWALMAVAAAGQLVTPPSHATLAVIGMALLIVRQRMREACQ